MTFMPANIPDLVIASGSQNSNTLNANDHYGDAVALGIISPSALDAHTYVFQVSKDGTTWANYQEGSTPADLGPPAAGKAITYYGLIAFNYLRIRDTTGNVAADRTFSVMKNYRT